MEETSGRSQDIPTKFNVTIVVREKIYLGNVQKRMLIIEIMENVQKIIMHPLSDILM